MCRSSRAAPAAVAGGGLRAAGAGGDARHRDAKSVSPGRQDASGSRTIRAYRALVPAVDDLAALPRGVAESAQVDANGGVWWHFQDAERAVNAPADAGHVILGLEKPRRFLRDELPDVTPARPDRL